MAEYYPWYHALDKAANHSFCQQSFLSTWPSKDYSCFRIILPLETYIEMKRKRGMLILLNNILISIIFIIQMLICFIWDHGKNLTWQVKYALIMIN